MQLDVKGKIDNTSLAVTRPLLPLYEAVVNSIQSIDDAQPEEGLISIHVIRDTKSLLQSHEDGSFLPITGFEIIDNGVGFNDVNYSSFCTSDTTYKKSRGGKGVGRFVWLVAFKQVDVQSIFTSDDGRSHERTFSFVPEGDGIKDLQCSECEASARSTSVKLIDFYDKYQSHCPKKPETIAWHIAEHCLEFFIRPNCPTIELIDSATVDRINLNKLVGQGMVDQSQVETFEVKGHKFTATHLRLYGSHANDHLSHYCADDRVVKSTKLRNKIPNVTSKIEDSDGKLFQYAAYVDSPLLNETANSERTGFAIDDDDEGGAKLFDEDITWNDISDAVLARSKQYLKEFTDPVLDRKKERIDRFVSQEAPMYRPIMPYISEAVEKISPDLDDDELDLELYRAYHTLAVETKRQGTSLLATEAAASESLEEYSHKLEAYFEKVTDINAADLARYVCHRKAILDFLQKLLGVQDGNKYALEKHVHNIIFPMGATSSDVMLEDHNLWLVDEKLAYHSFLASDKQLRSLPSHNGSSSKEPDIIVYDSACAFTDSEDDFSSITLVEFKRPMLKSFSEEKNPFVQVCEYIDLLRGNRATTPSGREITIPDSMPFYCYVVCDMCPQLETWTRHFELTKTPDEKGYFGFKKSYNAYFEVISYNKLVGDAKKRNAIFFDKLNLPSRIKTPLTKAVDSGNAAGE